MNLSFLKEKGSKYIVVILIVLLVLVLIIPTSSREAENSSSTTETAEEKDLEKQLKRVLEAMEGVGSVEVMITLEEEESSIFGTTGGTGKVRGVVVVAEGAGNAIVETRISNAIKALFSIDAHKISIVKRAMQEEDR